MKDNGYLLITTFDAEEVNKCFNEEGKITIDYTNELGENKLMYDIIKMYDTKNMD